MGLESLTSIILDGAKSASEKLLEDAKKEADLIISSAQARSREIFAATYAPFEKEAAAKKSSALSMAKMEETSARLDALNWMLDETCKKAMEALFSNPSFLEKVKSWALGHKGGEFFIGKNIDSAMPELKKTLLDKSFKVVALQNPNAIEHRQEKQIDRLDIEDGLRRLAFDQADRIIAILSAP